MFVGPWCFYRLVRRPGRKRKFLDRVYGGLIKEIVWKAMRYFLDRLRKTVKSVTEPWSEIPAQLLPNSLVFVYQQETKLYVDYIGFIQWLPHCRLTWQKNFGKQLTTGESISYWLGQQDEVNWLKDEIRNRRPNQRKSPCQTHSR